jgi:hypothetical protein
MTGEIGKRPKRSTDVARDSDAHLTSLLPNLDESVLNSRPEVMVMWQTMWYGDHAVVSMLLQILKPCDNTIPNGRRIDELESGAARLSELHRLADITLHHPSTNTAVKQICQDGDRECCFA